MSIDELVLSLKLKNVASCGDNIDTRTKIRFTGKLGEYEVRAGTDVLVPLKEGATVFSFVPVRFREEAIGDRDPDAPVFHYVRMQWNLNGAVRWTMYASP